MKSDYFLKNDIKGNAAMLPLADVGSVGACEIFHLALLRVVVHKRDLLGQGC